MSPKLTLPSVALHCPGFPKVVISLPWIALSLVTELVTVAEHCPLLPSRLVTELVTLFSAAKDRPGCWLACIPASFSFSIAPESTSRASHFGGPAFSPNHVFEGKYTTLIL